MKKTLLILTVLGGLVASAEDSYLYWMVQDSWKDYTTAKIRLEGSGDYLTIYTGGFGNLGKEVAKAKVDTARGFGDGLYAGFNSTSLPSTFIVELWNGDWFAGQAVLDSASLANYIYTGGMAVPPSSPAQFTGFTIPEPSSGLLMLVGCALLGLRRRKQKNA